MRAADVVLHIPLDCLSGVIEVFAGQYDAPVTITGSVTVLDIGANVGAFSLYARIKWPGSTIFAYEPHPEVFKFLEHNTSDLQKFSAICAAVGDPSRNVLWECPGSRTCGSQYEFDNKTERIPITVIHPSTLPTAEIVKIDTEGAEMDILYGLTFVPTLLLLEWHSEADRAAIDAWATRRGMMLAKSKVLARSLGVMSYVKRDA